MVAAADIVSILANNGSGTVAVSSATSFTGTAANVAAVGSSSDVTTATNFNSTLSDSGVAAAADIWCSILANNGSGTVAVSSATSFTGTAANTLVAAVVRSSDVIDWDKLQLDAE